MRIALLGPYPWVPGAPPGQPPLAGGVDAVVLALARGLARRPGLDVCVITAVSGLVTPLQVGAEGYPVFCVPRPRGGRLTGQRQVVAGLRKQLAAFAPDIAHAHIAGIHAKAALLSGLPAVVTLHGIIYREMQQAWPLTASWSTRLRWLIDTLAERAIVRQAREIIAINPYVQTEFRGRTQARFHTVENPVDDRFFIATPVQGRARLLCVARVIPRKGILTLIQAFALIAQTHPAATLAVAGEITAEPGYAAQCRALAQALGIADRVDFLGALPPAEVLAQYAAADLVVLASEQETAPVTIAEALAAGRPVVTTDVGGCAAMVADGVTGRVVPARNPVALAEAVLALLADPAACTAMGQAAQAAAAARFRLDAVAGATLAVYHSILEQS